MQKFFKHRKGFRRKLHSKNGNKVCMQWRASNAMFHKEIVELGYKMAKELRTYPKASAHTMPFH